MKKLTREQLRNFAGGQSCSVAIQGSDGTWVTRQGKCESYFTGDGFMTQSYYNTGMGMTILSSNGGVSRCNN